MKIKKYMTFKQKHVDERLLNSGVCSTGKSSKEDVD